MNDKKKKRARVASKKYYENNKEKIKEQNRQRKADNPENPYQEDFEYLECEWRN